MAKRLTTERSNRIVEAFRKAVAAQVDRWDRERDIEEAAGCELETEDTIKTFAASLELDADMILEALVQDNPNCIKLR